MKMKTKEVTVAVFTVKRNVQRRSKLMMDQLTRIALAGLRRLWTVLWALVFKDIHETDSGTERFVPDFAPCCNRRCHDPWNETVFYKVVGLKLYLSNLYTGCKLQLTCVLIIFLSTVVT